MAREAHDCPVCGYVHGATTGYAPLTPSERASLVGFEISQNVHGDEIARPHGRSSFNTARYELHKLHGGR